MHGGRFRRVRRAAGDPARSVTIETGPVGGCYYETTRNIEMISAVVNVVVRTGIHPAVLYTLFDAMGEIHPAATLISRAGEFPSVVATDPMLHPLAVQYAKSGTPWVYRNVPSGARASSIPI